MRSAWSLCLLLFLLPMLFLGGCTTGERGETERGTEHGERTGEEETTVEEIQETKAPDVTELRLGSDYAVIYPAGNSVLVDVAVAVQSGFSEITPIFLSNARMM